MEARHGISLRGKFIAIVLGGAVLPLALFGIWLTGTAERSAEALLRTRLDASMGQTLSQIGDRWLRVRSDLVSLGESDAIQLELRSADESDRTMLSDVRADSLPGWLPADLREAVTSLALLDREGTVHWSAGPGPSVAPSGLSADPVLPVRVDVFDNESGEVGGHLEAHLRVGSFLPAGVGSGAVSGSVLAVFNPANGASLLPLTIDPGLFESDRFVWDGEPWLTHRRTLREPAMELVLAAPLTPFLEPFQESARRNLILLIVVTVAGLLLATLLSWPVTRSLRHLANAAESVSLGDLNRRVEETGSDEVGRVARAFNAMTDSLRTTLRQLSQREALASVGEFAAALAHEVRNPLTSIRLDLQRIEEGLPPDSDKRQLVRRALSQIERVDQSVSGALRVARSGRIEREPVDIRQPLEAAAHEAAPAFAKSGAILEPLAPGSEPLRVSGNSAALEQLFLNLLLNAAEALEPGGRAGIDIETSPEKVRITVRDAGRGIAAEDLDRVFDAFYSTRPEGTGLGLAVAQRIAAAHGTELNVDSTAGRGTRVWIDLARIPGDRGEARRKQMEGRDSEPEVPA